MGLTRLAINRPLAILMLLLGLVLMGAVSYTRMKVDRFPAISFPAVFVSIQYAGAAPTDIEELIAKPVENAVSGLPGIESITSTSNEGSVSLNIRFVEGTETNQAAMDVERRISSIRRRLPEAMDAPQVTKADQNAFPIMNIAVSSNRPLNELFDLANDTILPRLQSVDGVADVQLLGGLQREIQVKIDPNKLRAYGVALSTVQTALQRENVSTPSGRVTEGAGSESVRALASVKTVEELKNLVIVGPGATGIQTVGTGANAQAAAVTGRVIRVQDIGEVVDTTREVTRLQRFNGADAVGFSIVKQADANSIQVADNVKNAITTLQRALPRDVRMTITSDTSIFTRRSIDAVIFDLNLAVVLTGIVLLLFLHTWRNTFIVLLAIPTSLISTFLVMFVMGFSLNIITLLALALTIGILVDDSIVVIENISRHLEEGQEPRTAALRGRSEIGLAAISITLVDVIVFLPVSFMTGNIGRLFKEFGITIAAATLFSLLVSFTLTPMLASRWLQPGHERRGPLARFGVFWDRGYDRLAAGYRWLLARALKVRWLVVAASFLILFGSYMMLRTNMIGSEYAPPEDDGNFQVSITMPPGTSLAGTDTVVRRVEAGLKNIPEVENVFTTVGGGGGFGGGGGTRSGSIAVQLKDKHHRERSVFQVLTDVRRIGRSVPEAQVSARVQSPLAGGGGSGVNIRIAGEDLGKLSEIATQIETIVRETEGAVDANNNAQQRDPEVRAVLDRERLADLRLNATQVSDAMRTMVGGIVVTQLRPDVGNQVDIRLIANDATRANPGQLGQLPLVVDATTTVRLDQVALIAKDAGPARIQRTDRQRVVEVNASVSGRSLGDVARDVRAQTDRLPLPEGYRVTFAGQVQQLETAFLTLISALALSVVLVYMLMVALYESWLTPFAIMFSLPVALVGAFLGLYLTGNTFNIFSLIGMIMLMGLVGKNAILLIDFCVNLRRDGMERTEAILESGYIRLRPILMTTSTVIFAMLPLAMKLEEGGESRAPLAVVIIGGVISSTMLTLVLVPSVYTILDDAKDAVGALTGRLRRGRPASAEGHSLPAVPTMTASVATPPPVRGGSED
ncbi:MAG: efflux RND transporter permease subunit [Chloroflexi bacterium]|nr:efflux RND transporter permease subunit [Chloroflexota bacterium]